MNRLERRILLIYPSDLDGFAGEMYIYEDPLKILADGAYHKNYEKNILGSGVIISQFIQNRYLLITEAGDPFGLIMIVDIVNKDVLELSKVTIVSILLEGKFSEPSIRLLYPDVDLVLRTPPFQTTNPLNLSRPYLPSLLMRDSLFSLTTIVSTESESSDESVSNE
ncbi:hypothetical protein C1646_802734 [Rhizophagus diaphanus]|nr:hypothetical protein C1646_802734 [Rhizophagus diaphanus] [Rhizophagus sp. MUCL 43196]